MCNVLDFIPTGHENAISRRTLRIMTGLSDREVRQQIHDARRKIPIINLQNGDGYYIPDMNSNLDRLALREYVTQETDRRDSIDWALKAARQTMENCGME